LTLTPKEQERFELVTTIKRDRALWYDDATMAIDCLWERSEEGSISASLALRELAEIATRKAVEETQ
jgi:hypothetical protein